MTASLVVGLGRVDRGDDAIGPEVVRTLADRCGPNVEVLESDQPADLMDLWSGRALVVVVDAVRSGAPPGTIQVFHLGADNASPVPDGWRSSGQGGTHSLGIDDVVGLARVMGSLPSRLVLVCVEGSSFEHGATMSPAVADAVEATVAEVVAELVSAAPDGFGSPLSPEE